jgi:hypothetical protein
MTIRPIELQEPKEYKGWTAWAEEFRPITNHLTTSNGPEMFETYGPELDFVQSAKANTVWTRIQGDMSDVIVAGYCFVNRLGYYITEKPWVEEDTYCLLSEDIECLCYKQDGYENGESGDPSCEKCEGYGYTTYYPDEN